MEANKQIELTSSELKELLTMGGDDDTDDEEDVGFGGTEKTVAVNAEQLLKDLEEKEKIEDEDDQDIERIRLYQERKAFSYL